MKRKQVVEVVERGARFGKTYSLRVTPEQEAMMQDARERGVRPSTVLSLALDFYRAHGQPRAKR